LANRARKEFAENVHAQVLVIGHMPPVAGMGNGLARKIQSVSASGHHTLTWLGSPTSSGPGDGHHRRAHAQARLVQERLGGLVYNFRRQKRLIALHVDHQLLRPQAHEFRRKRHPVRAGAQFEGVMMAWPAKASTACLLCAHHRWPRPRWTRPRPWAARSMTCCTMGLPPISTRGLPGNRLEP
jgi:hypothetical protein